MVEVNKKDIHVVVLYFLVSFLILSRLIYGYPPGSLGDAYGHIFKIYWICHMSSLWSDAWYTGYPIFFFYPPLIYYLGGIFCKLTNEIVAYKILMFLSLFLSGVISYFAGLLIVKNRRSSFIASLFYYLNPFRLKMIVPEGNLPMFFAYSFLPLVVLIAYNLKNLDNKKLLAYSAIISIIALSHHATAFICGIILLIFLFYFHKEHIFDVKLIKNTVRLFLATLAFVSFFYIPFLLYKHYAYFLTFQDDIGILKINSANPLDVLLAPKFEWTNYISILPILLFERSILYISNLIFIILSFGIYSPLNIYNLPLLNVFPPYRYLIIVLVITWYLILKKSLDLNYFKILFALIAILIIPQSVISIYLNFIPEHFDSETYKLLRYLSSLEEGRIWFPDIYPLYSFVSYIPAITGKPVFNGWYREGNPIFWEYSELRNNLLLNKKLEYKKFIKYNIKYVVLNWRRKDLVDYLENLGFKKIYESSKFVVLQSPESYFIYPDIEYSIEIYRPNHIKLKYDAENETNVTIAIGYFPFWKAFLDGKEIKVKRDRETDLISLELPAGNHSLELIYRFLN